MNKTLEFISLLEQPLDDRFLKALDSISEREAEILLARAAKPPWTLKELGVLHGITGQRVRQIEIRAVRRLMHPSKGLRRK